jgi:lauroyl/myristoyl acyltransferase
MPNPLILPVMRWLGRLSHPRLFLIAAGLFVANTFILDPIPFIDEILLGIGTLMLANWKNRKAEVAAQDAPIESESRR